MSKVRGVLEKAYQGKGGFWSIKIAGDENWYGTYKDDHSNLEGQEVEFEATKRGQYWNAKNIKAVPGAKPAASSGGGGGYDPNERQASIVLQSSYKTAAEVLAIAAANDALPLGNKKADKLDILMGMLDEVAVRIYNNCSNPLEFLGGNEEPAPGPDGDDNWEYED